MDRADRWLNAVGRPEEGVWAYVDRADGRVLHLLLCSSR